MILYFTLTDDNYVDAYSIGCTVTPNPIELELDELPYEFETYYKAYIYDVETQTFTLDEEKYYDIQDEIELENLRGRREVECFDIVNRGELWYKRLTPDQSSELDNWYGKWLDVTITLVIPTKPEWLK